MLPQTTLTRPTQLDDAALALPTPPDGHFWRVTEGVWGFDPLLGHSSMRIEGVFQVRLYRRTPTFFRRDRAVIVAWEDVYLDELTASKRSVAQGTLRAAEKVLKARGERIEFYTALKRVQGDYS